MPEQQLDTVTELANVLRNAERSGLIQPDSIARMILASGVVVPNLES